MSSAARPSRLAVRLAAVLAGGAMLVATGAAVADADPITGGTSTIGVSRAARTALGDKDITVAAVAPAKYAKSVLTFPNRGGSANPPNYVVKYAGGITFTHGSAKVTIGTLIYNTDARTVYGVIGGRAQSKVFAVGDPQRGGGGPGKVQFGGYTVTWTSAAATLMDKLLNTTYFTRNRSLGTGDTDVRF